VRIASEEVLLHFTASKCMSILLYGLEALPLNKSQLSSLDFTVNRFLVKLFNSNDMQSFAVCSSILNCRVNRLDIVVRNLLILNL